MTNKYYRTQLSTYKESEALQQLLDAINDAISNERLEQLEDDVMNDEFVIIVNGVQTAFYLGGPQVEGLYAFMQHIASENFYTVDINNGNITSHLL